MRGNDEPQGEAAGAQPTRDAEASAQAGDGALPPVCAGITSLLPAFHAGTLEGDAARAVLDHVATCAGCAARFEQELAETYALLRAAPQPSVLPGVRAALYARITAAKTGLADPDSSTVPAPPIAEHPMNTSEPDPIRGRPPTATSKPVRRLSRWLGSIAAILVVALLAAVVVTHTRGAGQPSTALPTTTADATAAPATPPPGAPCTPSASQVKLPARPTIFDMTLTSAREGWLVGAVFSSDYRTTQAGMILHYANCGWQPVQDPLPNAFLDSIAMVSPTEGWVTGYNSQVGESYLLHLANGHWQQVPLPYQPAKGTYYSEIRMLSAQEGWIVVEPQGVNDQGRIPSLLLRYHDGTWTQVTVPVPLVYDLAPVGQDDLWVVGNATTLNRQDSTLAHYQAGRWTATPAPGHALIGSLRMLSPNDGYAIGWQPQPANSGPSYPPAAVLHYDGTAWTAIQTGADPAAQTVILFDHVVGWAFVQTPSESIPGNDVVSSAQREVGGRWQSVAWPFSDVIQIGTIVAASADEYWATAFYEVPPGSMDDFHWELLHFVNGAWHAYGHH